MTISDEDLELQLLWNSLTEKLRNYSTEQIRDIARAFLAGVNDGIAGAETGRQPPETTAMRYDREISNWKDLWRDFAWWAHRKRALEMAGNPTAHCKSIPAILVDLAHQWREKHNMIDRGVVVIWLPSPEHRGEIQGWVNELRNPEQWRPGCLAVDVNDTIWFATGGDDQRGAAEWIPY